MAPPPMFDEDALRQLSQALSQGRRVRFTPDGDPSTSLEASGGMQQPAADFLGTKVDEIQDLLGRGFEVNVDPDGSIYAFTPDRSQRYLANPDAALDTMEREFVHQAIRQGAHVVIEADGSIAYHRTDGAAPPSDDAAAARIAHFDAEVDGGALAEAARHGRQFELAPEGTMSYVGDAPDTSDGTADPMADAPDSTADPAASPELADAFDDEALRADAVASAAMAARIRQVTYDHFSEQLTDTGLQRDEAARRAWSMRQEAAAADMQVKRETANLDRYHEHMQRWETDYQAGDDSFAKDTYDHARAMAAASQARLDSATQRAADLRAQADAADADVQRFETQLDEHYTEYQALSEDANDVETRASLLDSAATMATNAEAADARAAQLREQGDEAGADAAAKEATDLRRGAEDFARAARSVDVDEQRLEDLGIDVPDGFEQPYADPADDPMPTEEIDMEPEVVEGTPPTVIDMEPEIIEGTPPTVIDMEPEVIEVTPPTVIDMEPEVIEVDLQQIDAAEQELDDLPDF